MHLTITLHGDKELERKLKQLDRKVAKGVVRKAVRAGAKIVQQQIKTNELMDQLVTSSLFGQASSLIGRTVTSADGSVSGIVASVTMIDDGLTAILEDGRQVPMGNGVNVSK